MKKNLFLLLSIVIISIGSAYAQTEITVDPGFNTLRDALIDNPGATLILTRGEEYVNDEPLLIVVPTIIKGEATPAETAPAVISLFADPGAGAQNLLLPGANLTLQNVGLMGYTEDEQQLSNIMTISAPDITVIIDGCVIQGVRWMISTNDVPGTTIILKNSKLFNFVNEGFDNWGGYGTLWGGNHVTYESYNNTVFMAGRIYNAGWIGPDATETLDHNTYVNLFGELFYPSWAEEVVVTNNILYNCNIRGYVGPRTQPEVYAGDFFGDYPNDTLNGDVAIFPNHTDSTSGDRNVVITNNLRFTNSKVLDKQASIGATMEPFLCNLMKSYGTQYSWTIQANLVEGEGSVDPQFEMGAIPDEAFTNMFLEIVARRRPSLQVEGYPWPVGWWPNGALKGDFIWPLPFNFKPMNTAIYHSGDDGYPYGDLNWFGPEVVAAWEAGEDNPLGVSNKLASEFSLNNYPNPFSSSTMITYNLPKQAKVTLKVYNAIGAEVATLVDETQSAGNYRVSVSSANLSNGMYFYRIQVGEFSQTQKMSVVK